MKAIRTLAALALVAALSAAIHPPARATTLKRMSVADLSRAAHTIVRVRCVTNSTRWDAGEIWTFTTFDVEEIWKGSAPAQITVRLLGGQAGNFTSTVSGVPRFAPGEELILFLERTPAQDFSIVSWMQGTFRIGAQTAQPAKKSSRRIPPPSPSSIPHRTTLKPPASAKCQSAHSALW